MGFFDKIKQKITGVAESLTFDRLKEGLAKTRDSFVGKLRSLLSGRSIDDALLADIEELLITSDVGVSTSEKIIVRLKERVRRDNISESELIIGILKEEIADLIATSPSAPTLFTSRCASAKSPATLLNADSSSWRFFLKIAWSISSRYV